MNFAEKMIQEQGTDEETVTITKGDFKKAIVEVMSDMANDPEIDGSAKLLMPLVGMVFAKNVMDKLFR